MYISRDHLAIFEPLPRTGWVKRAVVTTAIAVAFLAVIVVVGRHVRTAERDFTRAGQTLSERPAAEADIVVGH